MGRFDKALLRIALVLAIGYYGWQFVSQTVLFMVNQQQEIVRLRQILAAQQPPQKGG